MENNVNSTSLAGILAKLTVPYNNEVLTNDTEELRLVNYFFDSISSHNKEVETLLYEVIGYSLTKTAKLNKAFIFKGNGRNGKSKIFRILEALLEVEEYSNKNEEKPKQKLQCSYEHLEKLSGSKAGSKSTVGCLKNCTVNIAEDQKQPKYINTSLITRLISGEPIVIEQKGQEQEVLEPFATMLFSVNEVIDFKETGIFITDRFVVIPFNETFTDNNNNRDINIGDKLCDKKALQIIATRAIQAFEKVLENGKFTIPPIVEQETKNYFWKCNNVLEFCSAVPIKDIIVKSEYYNGYKTWCKYNNEEAVSNAQFGKEVLALGYRAERYSFSGKRNTYYASHDFNNDDTKKIYNDYLIEICDDGTRDSQCTDEDLKKSNITTFSDYLYKRLFKENSDIWKK